MSEFSTGVQNMSKNKLEIDTTEAKSGRVVMVVLRGAFKELEEFEAFLKAHPLVESVECQLLLTPGRRIKITDVDIAWSEQ